MLLILDLDGTILDSQKQHINSFVKAIKKAGLYAGKDIIEGIKKRMGRPGKELLEEVFPEANKVTIKILLASAKQIMIKEEFDNVGLLPTVKSFLKKNNKKHSFALATSANKTFAIKMLEKFNLRKYFDVILTADDLDKPKPDPEILLRILEKTGVDKKDVIFFGDTIYDYETAKNAGVRFVAVIGNSLFSKQLKERAETIQYLGDFNL